MNEQETRNFIISQTHRCFAIANETLRRNFTYPDIRFSVRGACAGKASSTNNSVNFNLQLAMQEGENFVDTIIHECSHIIADKYFDTRCCHKKEWRWVMSRVFGKTPARLHNYDVSNVARKRFRFRYACCCENGVLAGPKHHNSMMRGVILKCKRCGVALSSKDFFEAVEV